MSRRLLALSTVAASAIVLTGVALICNPFLRLGRQRAGVGSAPLYSYRVPIIRDRASYTGVDALTEKVRVRANNTLHAQLAAR